MKSIFYGIYFLGAVIGSVCALALEPLLAALVVVFTPVAIMAAALASGKVRFYQRSPEEVEYQDPERMAFPTLAAIDDEDLTDVEAFEKYGHQIAIELDAWRAMLERRVEEVKTAREQYDQIMLKSK